MPVRQLIERREPFLSERLVAPQGLKGHNRRGKPLSLGSGILLECANLEALLFAQVCIG